MGILTRSCTMNAAHAEGSPEFCHPWSREQAQRLTDYKTGALGRTASLAAHRVLNPC